MLIATVALVLLIGAFYPNFLEFGQLTSILRNATYIGILACGMAFLLAMRELDLSVGSIYALTALACAMACRRSSDSAPRTASSAAFAMRQKSESSVHCFWVCMTLVACSTMSASRRL